MTWTSKGTTNCCLCRKAESTLGNFANLLTSSARRSPRNRLSKRLEGLGFKATLEPLTEVA